MSCGRYSLVGLRPSQHRRYRAEAGVFRLACKSWSCSYCGPRKVKREIACCRRGMRLGRTRFITITSPSGEDAEVSYAELPKRFHRFIGRVQRRFGKLARVEYYAVIERQRRGAAHIHMVYRGPFIPQAWLSRAAEACGFGRVADIRKAPPNIANYLAKYLVKELSDPRVAPPRYFRRVRVSRGWSDWQPTVRERPFGDWWIVDAGVEHTALSAQRRGYLVVEATKQPEAPFQPDRVPRWFRPASLRDAHASRSSMPTAALMCTGSSAPGRAAAAGYFRRRHRFDRWARGTKPVSVAARRRATGKTGSLWDAGWAPG
jgi:hypothetical protein